MTKVLGGITKALVIEPEDKESSKPGGKSRNAEPIFDRAKVQVCLINLTNVKQAV